MARKSSREALQLRKARIRKQVTGTSERPRLCVYRSNRNIYSQIIDDTNGVTIASASTQSPELREGLDGNNVESAAKVGTLLAQKAKDKGIVSVVFDRGGYRFHGKVKALADAAREAGLQF